VFVKIIFQVAIESESKEILGIKHIKEAKYV
jgi:hypothetical protein